MVAYCKIGFVHLCILLTIFLLENPYINFMTTIRNILWDSQFQQKKVLEKLICHYLWISKESLVTSYDMEFTAEQLDNIKKWYNAYTIDKKPLEFIMWYVEFFQRKFTVDQRCLIPRPETEYMIEAVNEEIAERKQQLSSGSIDSIVYENSKQADSKNSSKENNLESNDLLFDIGTWCGVLGLSVLLENPAYFSRAYLCEFFQPTYTLACENFAHYSTHFSTPASVVQADLLDFITKDKIIHDDNNIILVANLPYIPDETFDTQAEDNVKKREPRPAFVWGSDWLDLYRKMFEQMFAYNAENNFTGNWTMFLEMMTWQVDVLRKEFGDKIDFSEIKTFHFNIRIVKGTLKG